MRIILVLFFVTDS